MSKLFEFFKRSNCDLCEKGAISSSKISSTSLNRPSLEEVREMVGDDRMSIWVSANRNTSTMAWKCEYYIYGKGRNSYSSSIRDCASRKECYLLTILEAIKNVDKSEDVSTVVLEESVMVATTNDSEEIIKLRERLVDIVDQRDGLLNELVCVNVGNLKGVSGSHVMPIRWREQKDSRKKGLFDRQD